MPHLLRTIKLRIQTALVELMMWQAMVFLPNTADPFLHNKLLAQPHQLGQIAASVPNSKAALILASVAVCLPLSGHIFCCLILAGLAEY